MNTQAIAESFNSFSLVTFCFIAAVSLGIFLLIRDLKKFYKQGKNLEFIKNYEFSEGLKDKFAKFHNYLDNSQQSLVFKALKDYFLICHKAKGLMVSMPSQILDEAWHEFILFTKDYEEFCRQGFGYFLHHTPTEAITLKMQSQHGIKLAWKLACQLEEINPAHPDRLPLVFEIDSLLNLENGLYYRLDCLAPVEKDQESCSYCVADFTDGSNYYSGDTSIDQSNCGEACGSDGGSSCGSDGGSSCGSSCGGGCGGCGCGGGGD